MVAGLETIVAEIATDERCTVEVETLWSISPIDFHPELVEFAADIVENLTGIREVMPSGPMHDSAEMARAGVPTIMMFVPSINGLSHTNIEDTAEADIELGVVAFDQLVRKMISWCPST
jgi:beta-ureidopropionase / N-carbamoyl-L-amino-acid hydrolase